MMLTRRAALLGLTAAWTLGRASLALTSAATEQRLVVVILRGALDGLAAVVPYGDPHLAAWRPELLPPAPGQDGGVLDLGGFYGLHPALTGMHSMYAAGEMLPVHAVAGPYRVRSHFEAQDYLESGADQRLTSGWLNRVVCALPAGDSVGNSLGGQAVAIGISVPLLLRGRAEVGSWAPQSFAEPEPELYARIAALHRPDPVTGPAIAEGLKERGFTDSVLAGSTPAANRFAFPALAAAAGRMLAATDGPRIAALELGGWDTHAGQVARLNAPLRQLDAGLMALKIALGEQWRRSAVLVMTEFGRTVRMNGTKGTDHGTATVAFLLGGAISGGRVLADWPGLSGSQMLDNRDLAPTTDLRSIAKGLLAGHLGLREQALASVFPDSGRPNSPPSGSLVHFLFTFSGAARCASADRHARNRHASQTPPVCVVWRIRYRSLCILDDAGGHAQNKYIQNAINGDKTTAYRNRNVHRNAIRRRYCIVILT